jgi:hypothetical protein
MNNALSVKISSRKNTAGQEVYEGTVNLEGTKPTKLSRKADGSTHFTSRSAVQGAARRFAERYGYNNVDFGQEASKTVVKKAAKKSMKTSPKVTPTPASI